MLFEQYPYFVRRRSRASGYRHPFSSRVWSASRVETLPSVFRAGRRIYGSWTVRQCWYSIISTLDSFSFLILAFACHPCPVFVLHPRFHQKPDSLFVGFRFCFPRVLLFSAWTGPYHSIYCRFSLFKTLEQINTTTNHGNNQKERCIDQRPAYGMRVVSSIIDLYVVDVRDP